MNRIILSIVFLLFSNIGDAQLQDLNTDSIDSFNDVQFIFIESIEQAEMLARRDIDNQMPFLLIQGGIAPVVYASDKIFQEKYLVLYYDLGCISSKYEYIIAYNKQVFKSLDKKFGKKWRRDIHKDVIGLKQYKKANRR